MKKMLQLLAILLFCQSTVHAADLLQVYQQAQSSDPIYQQAIAQRLSTKEGLPISISQLLPNISGSMNPSVTRTGVSGTNYTEITPGGFIAPRNTTTRNYTLALTATQTIFNFAQFAGVAGANATSKGADATLNAALQNLIIRVANAYFAVLQDEDNLVYSETSKTAYAQQLDEIQQQYKVGLKTVTDVYTAQARYDSSAANFLSTQAKLATDRENLRTITGVYYPHLSKLSERFPLITPKPTNIETWVSIALAQNWSIRAQQYSVETSLQNIRQQFGGHLPTVNVQGVVSREYTDNNNGYNSIYMRNGPGTETDRSVMLTINAPIFEGGGVVAQTNQATYNYQVAQQVLEQTVRTTTTTARQSYLNIISGISQIQADKQAIISNTSSLEGMTASYQAGTETLVNVLNQQEILYRSQTQFATDRYAYVNNLLTLKQAAGTLSFDDLRAINAWLSDEEQTTVSKRVNQLRPSYSRKRYLQRTSIEKKEPQKHVRVKSLAMTKTKHQKLLA